MSTIPHSAACRRPTPTLRASWKGESELHCPGCGRTTAVPDGPYAEGGHVEDAPHPTTYDTHNTGHNLRRN